MTDLPIPNDYTACERYGGYIIAVRGGIYCAFTNFLGKPVENVSGSTRAEVRRKLDDRAVEAGNNTITSGSFPTANGTEFVWMLQGTTHPEIYGWLERDHVIAKAGGFWRTPDPDEAFKRACIEWELEPKKEA